MTVQWVRKNRFVVAICSIACALIIAAIAMPNLVTTRIARNQWNTSYGMEHIAAKQKGAASSTAAAGYVCDLNSLRDSFSEDGKFGYLFSLHCSKTADRVVGYQVTAVPKEPGKSGIYAFCLNENGAVWYSKDGSPDTCLSKQKKYDISD